MLLPLIHVFWFQFDRLEGELKLLTILANAEVLLWQPGGVHSGRVPQCSRKRIVRKNCPVNNLNVGLIACVLTLERKMISIDVSDEMSLLEKLRESYHGRYRDDRAGAVSDRMAIAFFWFITVSEVYVGVQCVVPQQFAECSEWTRYCLRVCCWFVFVQTIANWACIRYCRRSSYRVTDDQLTSYATFRYNTCGCLHHYSQITLIFICPIG